MTIKQQQENGVLTICLEGRLDTTTAPSLDQVISTLPENAAKLILDCTDLDYVSSAGLRVILRAQKAMAAKEGMVLRNVNDMVLEVFEITGFSDILTIE